jgi:surfactin synthase thioesterase subunit
MLADLGGCPPGILEDPEIFALYEPVLRSDFQAIANYRYTEAPPLDCPITVLTGAEDNISEDEARQWQCVTTWPLRLKTFPGGHFFILRHWHEIQRLLSEQLQTGDYCQSMPN